MSIKNRVYAVTINYKCAQDTASCVASLQGSTIPVAVVVVDNSPNDLELEQALAPFAGVHLIRAPENLGFGRGNNLGIEWALSHDDCGYVLILNNDATIRPDAVQRLLAALDLHPEAGMATPRIVLAEDETRLWYGGGEVDWRRGGGRVPGVLGPADATLAMQGRFVTFASGCAMLIRGELLRSVGGFDERFFMYEEDLELCLRFARHGWKCWYEPFAVVSHVGQGSLRNLQGAEFTGAWSPQNCNLAFYVYHITRNRLLTMHVYAVGKKRIEFRFFFPLFLTVKLLRFTIHRRWDAIRAMSAGWCAYRHEIFEI